MAQHTVKVLRGSTNEALFIKQESVTIVVTHLAADISEAECNASRRHQEHTVICLIQSLYLKKSCIALALLEKSVFLKKR